MDRARDYIAGVFPLHLETTGQVAARISEIQVFDLAPTTSSAPIGAESGR